MAVVAVNLTTEAQPSTFVASGVVLAAYMANRTFKSPLLHGIGVQMVLWQALMQYQL
jgi:hypothetical protein